MLSTHRGALCSTRSWSTPRRAPEPRCGSASRCPTSYGISRVSSPASSAAPDTGTTSKPTRGSSSEPTASAPPLPNGSARPYNDSAPESAPRRTATGRTPESTVTSGTTVRTQRPASSRPMTARSACSPARSRAGSAVADWTRCCASSPSPIRSSPTGSRRSRHRRCGPSPDCPVTFANRGDRAGRWSATPATSRIHSALTASPMPFATPSCLPGRSSRSICTARTSARRWPATRRRVTPCPLRCSTSLTPSPVTAGATTRSATSCCDSTPRCPRSWTSWRSCRRSHSAPCEKPRDQLCDAAKTRQASTSRPAISQASRVIWTCRIGPPSSHHVESLGVDALPWHVQLDQRILHRVHHRSGSADEVLESAVTAWQVAREDLGRDEARLAVPVLGRPLEHVHHTQGHPLLEAFELVAERHAVPVAVRVEQDRRPDVLAVGHRAQHADQARDTHAARDETEPRSLVLVHRENAVRPVDVHRRARLERVDSGREIAQRLHRDLDLVTLGTRRERERMQGERVRRSTEPEPGELAGVEAEPRAVGWAQYKRGGLTGLMFDPFEAPPATAHQARLDQTDPDEQRPERRRHESPQDLLPERAHVFVDQVDVDQRPDDRDHGEHGVDDVPYLVRESQPYSPDRRHRQHDDGSDGGHAEPDERGCLYSVARREGLPLERQGDMAEDEGEPDVAELPMELQQGILTERCGHRSEAGHEHELESHHREPDEAQRDREVRPEPMVRLTGADRGEDQRRDHSTEVRDHPEDRSDRELHVRRSRKCADVLATERQSITCEDAPTRARGTASPSSSHRRCRGRLRRDSARVQWRQARSRRGLWPC